MAGPPRENKGRFHRRSKDLTAAGRCFRGYAVLVPQTPVSLSGASVPALPGCHTQAKSLDTLMRRVTEVIELRLMESPLQGTANVFIGVQRVAVAV